MANEPILKINRNNWREALKAWWDGTLDIHTVLYFNPSEFSESQMIQTAFNTFDLIIHVEDIASGMKKVTFGRKLINFDPKNLKV